MNRLAYLLLCTLFVLEVYAQQGTNSGTIMLESSGGTINTRASCSEALRCTGRGTRISWRTFRVRVDLVNTTSYYILTEGTPVEGDTTGLLFDWESTIVFPNLVSVDSNLYTCNVFDTTRNTAPELVSVQMNVDPEPAAIDPIAVKDISSYYVGEQVLLGCSVDTCATGVTVQFLFNDSIIGEGSPSPTNGRAYTASFPAQLDSAGIYTCRVTTDSPSYLILQSFNVTGTPMIRPTSSGGSSNTPSGSPASSTMSPEGTQAGTTQGNDAPHILPSPLISFLLVMAALWCVYRS